MFFMDTKYLKNILLYTLSALLSIAVILYIGYHLMNTWGVKVVCNNVELTSVNETVSLDAYIMRDETTLYADSRGNLGQTADDGEKVRVNQEVAKIYTEPDTEIRSRLRNIETQLELLIESSQPDYLTVSDTSKIDRMISDIFIKMKSETEENQIHHATAMKNELLGMIGKRNVITNPASSGSGLSADRIIMLGDERRALLSRLSSVLSVVYTPVSGYYYSSADGYETIFSLSKADAMTLADFKSMINSDPAISPDEAFGDSRTVAGKIVRNYEWFAACPSTKSKLRLFTEGKNYQVTFPNNSEFEIEMNLYRIISQTDSDDIVLLFKTTYMPDGFNYLRSQPAEVVEVVHTGYKVPLSAVRIADISVDYQAPNEALGTTETRTETYTGIKGVYVLEGGIVRFKRINVVYETEGYVVVSENSAMEPDGVRIPWLSLHDNLITEGKGLYEGKIIA